MNSGFPDKKQLNVRPCQNNCVDDALIKDPGGLVRGLILEGAGGERVLLCGHNRHSPRATFNLQFPVHLDRGQFGRGNGERLATVAAKVGNRRGLATGGLEGHRTMMWVGSYGSSTSWIWMMPNAVTAHSARVLTVGNGVRSALIGLGSRPRLVRHHWSGHFS
jgi:hypothetical protein